MALIKNFKGKSQERKGNFPDLIVFHKVYNSYNEMLNIYENSNQSVNFIVDINGTIGYIIPITKSGYLCETSINSSLMNYYARATNNIVKSRRMDANLYTITIDIVCNYDNDNEMSQEQFESIVWLINYIRSAVCTTYNVVIPLNTNYITGYDKIITGTSSSKDNPGNFIYDKIISSLSVNKSTLINSNSSKIKAVIDSQFRVGTKVTLKNVKIYSSATSTSVKKVDSGVYYLYDGILLGNKYAITNSVNYIGLTPASTYIKGYIYAEDVLKSNPVIPELSNKINPSNSDKRNSNETIFGNNVTQGICAGKKVMLKNTAVYSTPTDPNPFSHKTGTFYLYDGIDNSGRYRITNVITNVGKKPMGDYTIGFIDSGIV